MNWKQRGITVSGLTLFGLFCLAGFCWNNEVALWHLALLSILAAHIGWIAITKDRFVAVCAAPLLLAVTSFLILTDFSKPPMEPSSSVYAGSFAFLFALAILASLINIFLTPINLIVAIFSKSLRWYCLKLSLIAACMLLSGLCGAKLLDAIYIQQVVDTTNRYTPLVKAIESFEHDNARSPNDLSELVPKYLAEVPKASAGVAYRTASRLRKEDQQDTRWELRVPCCSSIAVYWPNKNYVDRFLFPYKVNELHPVGDWLYLDRGAR